ncbi:MAG: glycoside hydrolase family 13 protein [Clostridia bacterium]|nr:glycoside hydrolase family 13 protein [Clostridia bacterium]
MRILYDSKSELHKKPFGCLKKNEECTITIHIPESCKTKRAYLLIESDEGIKLSLPLSCIKKEGSYEYYSETFSLYKTGLYFYHFLIETEDSTFQLYKCGDCDTNMEEGASWQLSCIPSDFTVPHDFKGKVYYQIFPDRFYKERILPATDKKTPYFLHDDEGDIPVFLPDEKGIIQNNDFFGGNIEGIIKKLPYLKDLGVGVIYLNPIFSAYSNHRYDTSDYKKIDPLLGTEEDFKLLCEKAHQLGIKILLDGVFSHTGCDSVYFDKYDRYGTGAYHNPDSPYRTWYQFNNYPDSYTSWWGIDTLPCVNELSESFLNYIIEDSDSVVAHWLSLGADGFRLDVADELPDEFIIKLRKRVKEIKPDALVLGEVWEDASNKVSYSVRRRYFTAPELDSVMNYPFREAILSFVKGIMSAKDFAASVMTICENYPKDVLDALMNSLSTHDTPRILTLLSDAPYMDKREDRAFFRLFGEMKEKAIKRLKTAAFLQFCLPGCPCIYYGDEAGMEGFEDPFNRAFYPWGKENNEILDFFKVLSGIKNSHDALRLGNTRFIVQADESLLMERKTDCETLYAYVGNDAKALSREKEVLLSGENFALYKEK